MRCLVTLGLVASLVQVASGGMVISEWMYSGTDGEFIEFTNTGPDSVDMTGWSFDDDGRTPGTVDLSAFGVVAPGESVLLTEVVAADFAAAWILSGVKIIGENATNLGRNDEINLYDASGNLVDRLTYGDETYAGTIRTQNASGGIPLADYDYTVVQTSWTLAVVDDDFGSWTSIQGDIASPGTAPIPQDTDDGTTPEIGGMCGLGTTEAAMGIALGLMFIQCGPRRRFWN